MAEQSHREEMNAAIRAQRERQAVPRSIAPTDSQPPAPRAPEPHVAPKKSWFARLRGK